MPPLNHAPETIFTDLYGLWKSDLYSWLLGFSKCQTSLEEL